MVRRKDKQSELPPSQQWTRSSGILLHVSSLPGRWGIGDLGPAAYAWIDSLARAKQRWWQILPLGHGASPYQSWSAFAGSVNVISPDLLVRDGLLSRGDLRGADVPGDAVDERRVDQFKSRILNKAWERFRSGSRHKLRDSFDRFRAAERAWLDDFALFMALREANGGIEWTNWPAGLMHRKTRDWLAARRAHGDVIAQHQFAQFLFARQLAALRAYARDKGVGIIGDLPIFISGNSADVWANSRLFRLDRHHRPTVVAGCPPDAFSRTGQRWGNPLYNWTTMQRDGFRWWIERFRHALRQADIVRIDHFRGFTAFWEIPAHHPTAARGRWVKAPGKALFAAVQRELGGLPFIAEDLGVITPDVEALRDDLGLPGMKILQFAFDGNSANPYLPHNYTRQSVAYTGTHDNDTTAGWYRSLSPRQKDWVHAYLGTGAKTDGKIAWSLMRLCWSSVADVAIAPLQDLLGLDSEARMNTPGTRDGNWRWRVRKEQITSDHLARLAAMTAMYGRSSRA